MLAVLLIGVVSLVATNVTVMRATDGVVFDQPAEVPRRTVAIVFGTLVQPDGKPSMKLADRVQGAVQLYKVGRVGRVLMSGDRHGPDYDEVTAMRDLAVASGVPREAITRDEYGFDTYDTCARAKSVYGINDAVVVTQDYHIARAVYLCRARGIDTVGLAVPDWQHHPEMLTGEYPRKDQVSFMLREYLARTKAFVAATILRPDPAVDGPYEGLHPN